MPKNKTTSELAANSSSTHAPPLQHNCIEGERLDLLLKSLKGSIVKAKALDGNRVPEKIWFKQQFAIGVNEVTRCFERMQPAVDSETSPQNPSLICKNSKAPRVQLQAVLLAADCNPRWLTRHLPSLASSRNVPLIFVKDKKQGSLRLGELVNIKTAIAVGIKAKNNAINHFIEEILCSIKQLEYTEQTEKGEA